MASDKDENPDTSESNAVPPSTIRDGEDMTGPEGDGIYVDLRSAPPTPADDDSEADP